MSQADEKDTTILSIMRRKEFRAGVEDVRAGAPARFDDYPDSYEYARGRQFAFLVPVSMPLTIKGKPNQKALARLVAAFQQREIL